MRDGYSIDEVIDQIESAFSATAEVLHDGAYTIIGNTVPRTDSRGNQVFDRVVFECSEKKPSPLLWSVVPKGDGKKK